MSILDVQGLSKSYGPETLFQDISFALELGEKVGVIGRNGCGKSTLFRIIAGLEAPDGGLVSTRRDLSWSYVHQNPDFPEDATPNSVVAQAVAPQRQALEQFEDITARLGQVQGEALTQLLEDQARLQERIERLGGWSWEHRVQGILARLQIADRDMERPMGELSGGQRRRVALALALLERPDLLMLDEPTNHLDAETVEWLEGELIQYPGAVLLVTHDRYFLDRVVSRILEFDVDGVYSYQGNYSVYTEKKLERMELRQRTEDKRLKLLKRELAWLRRTPAARTGKSRARVNRAEDLRDNRGPQEDSHLQLDFQSDGDLGGIILEAYGLSKSYGERQILRDVHLMMRRKDKLGLLGPNGSGKSTLLRLLTEQERPDAGSIRAGTKTRFAIMDQDRSGLDPEASLYEALGDSDHVRVGDRRVHKRTYLKEFLFDSGQQNKRVRSLSGGERCRLLLAHLMAQNANLLILDEPTNDLDITSLQFLEQALGNYDGCVLLVTHDRYFLNRVCNALLVFEDQTITRFDGDYDFYRKRRDEAQAAEREQRAALKRQEEEDKKRLQQEASKDAPRRLSYKERKELEGMEALILQVEQDKEDLEAQLADPALYQERPEQVPALSQKLHDLGQRLEQLYTRWEELEALA